MFVDILDKNEFYCREKSRRNVVEMQSALEVSQQEKDSTHQFATSLKEQV